MPLYTIGQFSTLTRLSVKALRNYDAEGLLVPAKVDPATRYRFYSHSQVATAEMIRLLRSLELPVRTVKEILHLPDEASRLAVLKQHQLRLSDEMAARQRTIAYLESMLTAGELEVRYDIVIAQAPRRHIAAVRFKTQLRTIGADIGAAFANLAAHLNDNSIQPAGSPMVIYHDVIDAGGTGDVEVCIPIADTDPESIACNHEHPAVNKVQLRNLAEEQVAVAEHRGKYELIGPAYHALAEWIAANQFKVVGPPREFYLNDPQLVAAEQLRTRVEFPVQAAAHE